MGLFKSKEEKRIEQQMLIKKTMRSLSTFITEAENKKRGFIDSAKKAIKQGNEAQYSVASSGLKMIIARLRQAETMLLNIELASQLKDLAMASSQFLESMQSLSKDMIKIFNATNLEGTMKAFEKAMQMSNEQNDKIDIFLSASETKFGEMNVDPTGITDNEINALIQNEMLLDEDGMDADIDRKINSIKRYLN